MLSIVSKLLFALSGVALAFAAGYGLAVHERSGVALFVSLAVAAFAAGVFTAGSAVLDVAPVVPADAPPPERRATTTGAAPRGTGWSLAAAAALTFLAASAAIGGPVVVAGVLAVVVAAAGWYGRVWSEHPRWTPRLRERVSMRLLVPVGLPVATFLLAAVIAVSVSRILLAVSKNAAVLVALVVAVAILGACWWVASRPRLGSSVVVALAALAAASMVGAGIAGAVAGEREFHPHHEEDHPLHVVAHDIKFDKDKLVVPAGEEVTIEFVNKDDVFHNIAVYESTDLAADPVFNGRGFPGHDEVTYRFRAPPPGEYVFVCDFHPNMVGAFVAEAH